MADRQSLKLRIRKGRKPLGRPNSRMTRWMPGCGRGCWPPICCRKPISRYRPCGKRGYLRYRYASATLRTQNAQLLQTIPGIGLLSAVWIVLELEIDGIAREPLYMTRRPAQAAVAYWASWREIGYVHGWVSTVNPRRDRYKRTFLSVWTAQGGIHHLICASSQIGLRGGGLDPQPGRS